MLPNWVFALTVGIVCQAIHQRELKVADTFSDIFMALLVYYDVLGDGVITAIVYMNMTALIHMYKAIKEEQEEELRRQAEGVQ